MKILKPDDAYKLKFGQEIEVGCMSDFSMRAKRKFVGFDKKKERWVVEPLYGGDYELFKYARLPEPKWPEFLLGDPVLVRDYNDKPWVLRNLASRNKEINSVQTFLKGLLSHWTGNPNFDVVDWNYCKPATKKELEGKYPESFIDDYIKRTSCVE